MAGDGGKSNVREIEEFFMGRGGWCKERRRSRSVRKNVRMGYMKKKQSCKGRRSGEREDGRAM